MANYTMEVREMEENPLINGVFTFRYDFYGNEDERKQFEKLFIQYYYFYEIGFETPERFKYHLKAKLDLVAPYYRQLAMTEWERLRTVEEMMTSKNLKESTTHEQTITGDNETTTSGNSTAKTSNETSSNITNETTNTQSSTTELESTDTQNGKASSLSDGVSQASLDNGYLTTVNQTNGTSNQSTTQTGNQTTNQTGKQTTNQTGNQSSSQSETQTTNQTDNQTLSGSSNSLSDMNQTTKGNNEQTLKETTTYSSVGDIGIQTPAYAITEWRKVLININQLMIDECKDLFMKIY